MSTFKYETNLLDAKETEENTIKAWKIKIEPNNGKKIIVDKIGKFILI